MNKKYPVTERFEQDCRIEGITAFSGRDFDKQQLDALATRMSEILTSYEHGETDPNYQELDGLPRARKVKILGAIYIDLILALRNWED